jgi:CelD/BcsL family acetyltransferase involved in cellulose biosynthesis
VSRKYSPGDIALRKTIGACCADGLSVLDFSAGDSPYKRAWADDIIGLKNLLAATNVLGLCWISVFAAGVTLKRLIKTHPAAFRLVQTLRRLLFSDRSLTR